MEWSKDQSDALVAKVGFSTAEHKFWTDLEKEPISAQTDVVWSARVRPASMKPSKDFGHSINDQIRVGNHGGPAPNAYHPEQGRNLPLGKVSKDTNE